jgi:hypothetical protein
MPYAVRLGRLIYIFRNIALAMNSASQADMVVTGTKGAIVTVSTEQCFGELAARDGLTD